MRATNTKSRKVKRVRPAGEESTKFSFSSEDFLQHAIVGLLQRMPDHTGVQRLQGSQELGKDVIFYVTGGLGESVLCACVIKNKRITGKVDTSNGARTILFQAEQALDSLHVDNSGNKIRVEAVYVITPFDLPPATIISIEGKLKERASRVKFIGGSALFDKFKKYWPDYIADEAAFIEHLKETTTAVTSEGRLRKLAFQYTSGSVSQKLERVHISQDFHREVNALGLGEIFTSLPDPHLLNGKISESTIVGIQNRFLSFDEGLRHLDQWGLCPKAFDESEYKKSLEEFVVDLSKTWRTQLAAERKQDARNRRVDPDESTLTAVSLAETKTFEVRLQNLSLRRQKLLSVLHQRIRNLDSLIATKLSGVKSLASKEFLEGSQLNDCARSAPEGLFLAKPTTLRVQYPKDILDRWGRSIFIVGAPGYGKTSFCRWRALQDAERLRTGTAKTVPVYIALHGLSRVPLGTFEEAFLKGRTQSALTGHLVDSRSKVRIYLDGLDEVSSTEQRKAIVDLARNGAERNPSIQIVLTARDYITGTWLGWLPKVNISPFSDTQINAFVDKWFRKDSELNNRFCEQLATQPAIRALVRTPLLATLTSIVFMQTKRLPESRTRLYDIFIELLSGGWDSVKEVQRESRFGPRVKIVVLTCLAGVLQEARQRAFGDDELSIATKMALPLATEKDCRMLGEELMVDGIVNSNAGVSQFSHLSFQEFLAARDFIGSLYPDRVSRALELYLAGDNWWRDVLKFYMGLSSSPLYVCGWLCRNLMHLRNKNLEISTTNAYELLACFVESFPGFSIQEVARRVRGPLNYDSTLAFLRKAQKVTNP